MKGEEIYDPEEAIVWTDGGARPTNPGYAGFAVVVHFPATGREKVLSRYLGRRKTNNEAEFIGACVGISYSYFLGAREIELRCDSKLVVESILGNYTLKEFHLQSHQRDAQDRLNKLFRDRWKIVHVPRSDNAQADDLCTRAIYWGRKSNPFLPSVIRDKLPDGEVVDPFRLGPTWAA